DLLLLEGSTLTEALLEQRFGFKSTVAPNLLSTPPVGDVRDWRRQKLRDDWFASEWPTDPWTDENMQPERPVVDPDLLTTTDFRFPLSKTPASPACQSRSQWMSNRLTQLDDDRQLNGLDSAIGLAFGTPLPDLDALLADLTSGTDPTAAQQQLDALHLTANAFGRLMEIRAKDVDPSDAPTAGEWAELNSILGQAEKQKQFPAWIQDELAHDIQFTPRIFWLPLEDYTPPLWRGTTQEREAWA